MAPRQEPLSLFAQPVRHVVITVHGIRTFGRWQERLEGLLRAHEPGTKVHNYKYGFFSILAYLFPFLRWLATDRFRRELSQTVAQYPSARIDIVAHSFGTHLVGWGLMRTAKDQRPKIHTIILASSVLKTGFRWRGLLSDGTVRRVINECATRDWVVVLNQLVVLFTGASGILGFNGMMDDQFRNNWYKLGHSGYFKSAGHPSDEFMCRRWLPVLISEELPEPIDERPESWHLGLLMLFLQNAEPVKLAMYALPVVLLASTFHRLSTEAEAARQIAVARQLATQAEPLISDQGSFPELSALLSIESMRRFHFLGSDHALRRALPFVNSPSIFVLSTTKAFIFKVTPGPNFIGGVSAITLFDPEIRQQFLELDQQLDNLRAEEASKAFVKFDARIAQFVSLSPDGLYLATGSGDGTARVFDVQTGKGVSEIPHQAPVTAVAVSSGGRYVITGCSDGTIRMSGLPGGATLAQFKYDGAVTTAEFSGDGHYLMTASQDKMVRLFSVTSGKLVSQHKVDNQAYEIRGATLSFDGKYLAVESGPVIRVLNTSTWDQVQNFTSTSRGLFRLTFSPSGRYLAAVDPFHRVQILDLRTGKVARELSHSPVGDLMGLVWLPTSFSSDEKYMATVNRDNSISLFELSSGTEISNIIDEDIFSVQLGVDPPRNFAVGLDQATARHRGLGTVRALAFSSDGRYLVAAYTFSTDGKRRERMRILTDQETLVSRYLVRPDGLIAEACSRLKRNLTPDEWKQYLGDEPYRKTCPNLP